jgi:tRNA G26 N,N-dimethylase Trm1
VSGLRSIRYAKEIVSIDSSSERLIAGILSNDISKRAVERIQYNIDQGSILQNSISDKKISDIFPLKNTTDVWLV